MTTQEAIKLLRNDEYDTWCSNEGLQARDMAIRALEKQIPKKPIVNGNRNPTWVEGADLCPECLSGIGWFKYCENCGQRLDWEGK